MNKQRIFLTVAASALLVGGLTAGALETTEESEASLKAEAKISEQDAGRIALAKVPGGKIKSAELERENGKLIWSFDIALPATRNISELQVDAKNGVVVAEEIETPKDQAAEEEADEMAETNEGPEADEGPESDEKR